MTSFRKLGSIQFVQATFEFRTKTRVELQNKIGHWTMKETISPSWFEVTMSAYHCACV
jgi:hypothetical protein